MQLLSPVSDLTIGHPSTVEEPRTETLDGSRVRLGGAVGRERQEGTQGRGTDRRKAPRETVKRHGRNNKCPDQGKQEWHAGDVGTLEGQR